MRAGGTMFGAALAAVIATVLGGTAVQPETAPASPKLLLADTTHAPKVRIQWPTRDGKEISLSGRRQYKSQGDKTLLGENVEVYVALGGTRLDKGRGDPGGAVIRCGLYKKDAKQPFFRDIKDGGAITITVSGIHMNKPAAPKHETGLVHLKYMKSDLDACGIDSTGRNLFVTVDPEDPLKEAVTPGSGRFGWLDGAEGHGSAKGEVQADGSITLTFSIPYGLLRHTKDPELRTSPGTFFEPQHFHVEMELVPAPKDPA
jgi:hypothetical protein